MHAAIDLFGFGHGGSGAASWADVHLDPNGSVALRAVRLAGRESRVMESLATSVHDAALDAANSVLSCRSDSTRPIGLVGVCFGSLVAYECAKELRAAGNWVESLILFDAPFGYSNTDELGRLPDDEFERAALARGLLPEWSQANASMARMLRGRLQADVRAHGQYEWSTSPDLVASAVTCVTGRRLTSEECNSWRGAGERFEVVAPEAAPRCWLEDTPGAVAAVIGQIHDGTRAGTSP